MIDDYNNIYDRQYRTNASFIMIKGEDLKSAVGFLDIDILSPPSFTDFFFLLILFLFSFAPLQV